MTFDCRWSIGFFQKKKRVSDGTPTKRHLPILRSYSFMKSLRIYNRGFLTVLTVDDEVAIGVSTRMSETDGKTDKDPPTILLSLRGSVRLPDRWRIYNCHGYSHLRTMFFVSVLFTVRRTMWVSDDREDEIGNLVFEKEDS